MIIGYARLSGAIALTEDDKGVRGLWLEKRIALLQALASRGHSIRLLTKLTKPTAKKCEVNSWDGCDLLWVEFGGLNKQFYGEDIQFVLNLANGTRKPKVFFSDDPDLPMLWSDVKNQKEWTALYNCRKPEIFPKHPSAVRAVDFPVSGLQKMTGPSESFSDSFVYVGRPSGRSGAVKQLIAQQAPVKFFAKEGEYDAFGVKLYPPPEQASRVEFYRQALGCVALADKKHKELGFRTGRAYHAIMAGCPALVESDHWALREDGFEAFSSGLELRAIKKKWTENPELRKRVVFQEQARLAFLREKAMRALAEVGL